MRSQLMALVLVLGAGLLVGCASKVCGFKQKEIVKWFVPAADTPRRSPTVCENVAFLESAPTNRSFRVIGVVAPPDGKYPSWAQAVNAVRAAASCFGADAVYLISDSEYAAWGFSAGGFAGPSGGSGRRLRLRAKAIVWE